MPYNQALNLTPFGRWTLRDKATQRRLALRCASQSPFFITLAQGEKL